VRTKLNPIREELVIQGEAHRRCEEGDKSAAVAHHPVHIWPMSTRYLYGQGFPSGTGFAKRCSATSPVMPPGNCPATTMKAVSIISSFSWPIGTETGPKPVELGFVTRTVRLVYLRPFEEI